jgi:hypothetical protein
MFVQAFWIVLGAVLVALALNDVFQSAIVPRAVGRRFRPSYFAWRWGWKLWPAAAWKFSASDSEARENLLAAFAPGMLIGLLVMWTALLIVGYGAIFWGLRDGISPPLHSLGAATYFSGTSLTTMGFGDVVARSGAARALAILAGANGLGLFSIITAYLFALFGAFQAREAFVVMLGARTGTPPSGVDLLAIAGYAGTTAGFSALLLDAQRWTAQVMETHIAYPTLAYFRSSHDYQSWVGTLGVLLDAATLITTTVENDSVGEAHIFCNLARHAAHDLARHLGVPSEPQSPGLERSEFDTACNRLAHAGYALRERDAAWQRFSDIRASYAPQLNALARFFEIPPLQWIGDRGPVAGPH